ncbi:MAG: hypothetical protein EA366_10530 [Spirulina sp. DLM2.Bin59]|nr:MAG: hypothetical protein EA366_10530 [Spirulina sp. DLM2.Bin59]
MLIIITETVKANRLKSKVFRRPQPGSGISVGQNSAQSTENWRTDIKNGPGGMMDCMGDVGYRVGMGFTAPLGLTETVMLF